MVEEPARAEYAPIWLRLLAFIVDFIIIIVLLIATVVWGALLGIELLAASPVIVIIVPLLYLVGFWARRGQTPGKMLFRLKVVRLDGTPLGLNGALLRYPLFGGMFFIAGTIYALALPLIIAIGCYLISRDSLRRGPQDRMAGSRVIWLDTEPTLGAMERKQQ